MAKNLELIKSHQLAAPKGNKNGKNMPLVVETGKNMEVDYFHFYESLYRKEVSDWQSARAIRRDPFNMLTYHIQQLYKNALLDNHLSGAIENRMLRVLNKQFLIKDKDGNHDKERSAFIQTKWFKHIVRKALESKFFGYSAVLITDSYNGEIIKLKDVPRENIIPEKGLFIKNSFNTTGESLYYPDFKDQFIYIQLLPEAIGILERIAPLTIFKRHSWASWDEFEQLFGVPIRIARTAINTKTHKDDLQNWMETMGTSNYAIFDKQTDIEIKENNRSDSFRVFSEKIALLNKEMSKGILGQTMTMDDGSSQSQAEVHLETMEEVIDADISDIESWFNDDFIVVLRNLGYDLPEGFYLDIAANSSMKVIDKIKVDQVLMSAGWNPTPEYIQSTYEITLDEKNPRTVSAIQNQQQSQLGFFV